MSNASIDLDRSTHIIISFPTDFTSFFDSPKEGPSNEIMSSRKAIVLKNNLMKIFMKEVLRDRAILITLHKYTAYSTAKAARKMISVIPNPRYQLTSKCLLTCN